MLELLGLLVGGISLLSGVGWIAAIELTVEVLLWGQIAGAVLMVLFMGAVVIAAALGFGLAAAVESGSGLAGLLVGLFSAAGAGAVSLFSLIWYALRKGLQIAGCLLILQGLPDGIPLMAIGGVLYFIGFLWCRALRRSS